MTDAIQNGEAGSSVRAKLNENFVDVSALKAGAALSFDTVAALLANSTLTYTTAPAGTIVEAEGFRYAVAASAATDQHVTTAGGVKLYVQAGASGYNVKAFGAVGDGLVNDTAALQKAVTVSTGQSFYVPTGTYLLSANVLGDLTQVQNMAPGVTFSGFDVFNCAIFEVKSGGQSRQQRVGLPGSFETVGAFEQYYNTGTGGSYGRRTNYWQQGAQTSGFSIGHGIVSDFDGTNGGQGLASWLVAASPADSSKTFGVFGQEVNPINLAADMGYQRKRSDAVRWTGGIQVVPEAVNITRGGPNIGKNTTYGFAIAASSANNDLGKKAKTYNGFLAEEGSIAPDGRAFLASGASTGADLPLYGLQIDGNWQAGIDTQSAILSTSRAMTLAAGQTVQWGTSVYPTSITGDNATGVLNFSAEGATNFRVTRGASSVVNFLTARGNATGGGPSVSAEGADANIDISLTPKGTGKVTFGTRTASSDVPVTGYIEIKDAGGTVRRLAVVG